MKKFIETIKNIFRIEDLRQRILYTLAIIFIYRLGSHIVLPGIDPASLGAFTQAAQEGLMGMLDLFSGGAFSNASIFALGIMPYISASIVIQLMTLAVPYFQRLQKEGESGRKKINQITRYLTVLVVAVQAPAYIVNLTQQQFTGAISPTLLNSTFLGISAFSVCAFILLIAGTLFVMWLGERITDKGIGNGISLIIMIGIIARFPFALQAEFASRITDANGGPIIFIIEIIMLMLIISVCILLVQGTRRIPVQYAKRIVGNKQYGGVRNFLPLKVNAAGVMPIIFAQAIMFLPLTFISMGTTNPSGFWYSFIDYNGLGYNILFFVLIIAFTYFYTAITINPNQIAEDLKKNGGFIPGVKPGKQTANFIDEIMSRITLPGSIFLGLVAILPAIVRLFGVNQQFAQFFGGTSLLIMVGVVLDTLQQIDSHLRMRNYDGLSKSGGFRGRTL
ncbi:preprotein translocase subunit SecY [Bacteroidales bacterium OttesenSCG-928-B11]|nr:preprotein translocase subunit SecY [Bacteroidales bacterium OttesenSCG-928-E04]MDL2308730.1 preprotein translocase subunit SecY [Bacteroidales bacterium OttesenSCG-928-C03]MDL2312322.1 preprotein translocase subunit SecY [Bacteroidales bacterium OttesenSCG-928-B11]MDL2326439.1 preprotein translocase subunit SecY [Bacteroidales bacterium OttesenSCG-928-A14]